MEFIHIRYINSLYYLPHIIDVNSPQIVADSQAVTTLVPPAFVQGHVVFYNSASCRHLHYQREYGVTYNSFRNIYHMPKT